MSCLNKLKSNSKAVHVLLPLRVGFFNTSNRADACLEAIKVLNPRDNLWVLGVNEVKFTGTTEVLTDYNIETFSGGGKGMAAIFAPLGAWRQIWAPRVI